MSVGRKLEIVLEAIAKDMLPESFQAEKCFPIEWKKLTAFATQEYLLDVASRCTLNLNEEETGQRALKELTPESLYYQIFLFACASKDEFGRTRNRLSLKQLRDHLLIIFGTNQLAEIDYSTVVHRYLATAQSQCDQLRELSWVPWEIVSPPLTFAKEKNKKQASD